MPCGPRQLEQQGLIDAQRIGRIGPLIVGDAVAEEDARRERHHLADEGRCRGAELAPAEPIPVEPRLEASPGVAALIVSERARGRTGEATGAGDGGRPGFAIAAGEAERSAMGLGRGHG